MKLKNRKIKYAAIFCLCWFVVLVILVDGVLKFQTLVDYFGSYTLVEITLLLLVILPTIAVYKLTKNDSKSFIGSTWWRRRLSITIPAFEYQHLVPLGYVRS